MRRLFTGRFQLGETRPGRGEQHRQARFRPQAGLVFATSGPMVIGDRAFILYGGQAWLDDQSLRFPDAEMTGPDAGIGIAEVDPALLDL